MNKDAFDQFSDFDFENFSNQLLSFSAYELTILGFVLAVLTALPLNQNQQNALGNFFQLYGQTIETIASFNQLFQSNQGDQGNQNDPDLDKLKNEIELLKHEINQLKRSK